MNPSAPFIRRPIATSLLAAALLVLGVVAYVLLPVAPLPQVEFPTIQVTASLPGSSPETMASNVATPLERQLSLIPGVTQMTSNNLLGQTQITLQFDLSRDLNAAAQDVQAAISAAGGQLPSNLPNPPVLRKVNPAELSVLALAVSSDTMPISVVRDYAETLIAQKISRLPGVGQVNIAGAQKPAVRIRIDPRRAAALGLHLDAIRAAIVAATANLPKGQIIGAEQTLTVYADDQVLETQVWNDLIVGYNAGAPVRIRDIGEAVMGAENDQTGAYSEPGKAGRFETLKAGPIVGVLIVKEPGANVIKTVDTVKAALPAVRASLPASIDLNVIADRTVTIRASVEDVQATLLITVVLVVAVIFLFLRNLRATLIPSAVIPVSILATAAVMLPAGFSLNNLTLMAMSIAVGFVVDDAIVMVEAIWRRIEHGEAPLAAALAGSREIGFTILTISISLIAVFMPLMFMGGVVGRMMQEFALVLSAAVLVSVLLSLTLTPMLCAQFLRAPEPPKARVMRALEGFFHRLETGYARALDGVLRHQRLTMVAFAATLAATVALYATSKTGFFPQQDTGFLTGTMVAPQGSTYAKTNRKAVEVMKVIAQDPDVEETHYNFTGDTSQASVNVGLRSRRAGRRASATEILNRLRPRLAEVVGVQTVLQANQDIQIGARPARAQYQYTLSDGNLDELNRWTPLLVQELQKQPELKDVTSDQQSRAPSATLSINRDAANRFGISPTDIDQALYNQIGQRQVAQYFTQLNSYRVILEAPPVLQATPELFNSVQLISPRTHRPVPLSALVRIDTTKVRSQSIAHQDQFPATTISFNLSPGVSLGAATAAVERARAALSPPPTLSGSFQGTAQAFQSSLKDEPVLILGALLSVYVILGVLYESYIHPLTILSTLPSAGLGALLALRLTGHDLDVIGIIAIILLIGIVKKNGIMIVDVALKLEREGMAAVEAVRLASHQRLRPILMTTACALLGGAPMIVMGGTGSEFREPLGWAIVGGLLVSQALTLFTTPVIYVWLDRARTALRRPSAARAPVVMPLRRKTP